MTTTTKKRKIPGRQSIEQRRRAREARQLAAAPPPPAVDLGSDLVEITGSAKVDVHDPVAGRVKTDHQGAVGVLEDTYYNHERREHMARVRVGMRADGTGGQPRGIPINRLRRVVAPLARQATTLSIAGGKPDAEDDMNLMSNADRRRLGWPQDPDLPDYRPAAAAGRPTLAEEMFAKR